MTLLLLIENLQLMIEVVVVVTKGVQVSKHNQILALWLAQKVTLQAATPSYAAPSWSQIKKERPGAPS